VQPKQPQMAVKEAPKPKKTETVKQKTPEKPISDPSSEIIADSEKPKKSSEKSKNKPDKTKEASKQPKELPDTAVKIPKEVPETEKVATAPDNVGNQKCADLVFDTVYVVKQKKNSMLLHFVLKNKGNATASLLGQTNEKGDNIAVNVYMTSGLKLTRGSFLLDGIFFKDKETEAGLLLPGKLLEGEIEVNTENRTRFTPNLVFELDPFQTVQECNRTNNTKGLIVK
jgi:hypothetical protein